MNNLSELKKRISGKGDIAEIAEITGYNISYVRKVLSGQRQNDVIVKIAKDLVKARERVAKKYRTIIPPLVPEEH